jgi:hypothetical protein
MHATCPAYALLLDLLFLLYLVRRTNDKAPHYTVFSKLLIFLPYNFATLVR